MRTFIALPLPGSVQAYLASIQEQLKKTGADVGWIAPRNIHLTLKFLGEIDETAIEAVKKAIQGTCAAICRFRLNLSSLGGFPTTASPRVIWMGINEGKTETTLLADSLEEKLIPLGLRQDRPFSAHITIGRVRSGKNRKELSAAMLAYPCDPRAAPFTADQVILYKSTLSPKGPTYAEIFSCFLR